MIRYVVEKLPTDVAIEVSDCLNEMSAEKHYDSLKEAIIQRTGESEERRLHGLFNNLHLGQNKPSQLLRKMRSLLECNTKSDSVAQALDGQITFPNKTNISFAPGRSRTTATCRNNG